MSGPLFFVLAYAALFAIPPALLAWPLVERLGRLTPRVAIASASMVWVTLVVPPLLGVAIDRTQQSCSPAADCSSFILWWFGIPVGWLLGALVVVSAILAGRARSRNA